MNTICVIQARMSSTRLPGKVLMDLGGQPILAWVVRACAAAANLDESEIIIATSDLKADDPIADFVTYQLGHCLVRGSHDDVLERFNLARILSEADTILRVTGDCPFIDPRVISEVIELQKRTGAHYCSNVSPRTYPDGLDVECFTHDALMAAHAEATRPIDRECVTTWIERNRSRFPAATAINPIPNMEKERWVLDTAEDYKFCQAIAERWPWSKGPPGMLDILSILDKEPELRKLNASGIMNERYFQALVEEPLYPRSYARSQKQLEKANAVIPLGAQTFSKSKLQFPQPSPLFLSHGQGGLCWDIDGNEYVDLMSALLPNILGYRDNEVDGAIRRQLDAGISFSLATELEAQLAETLCRLIPCAEAVRFGKTGTDATTAAIRVARAFTGRDHVLICGGYHGWADWSVERNLGVPEDVRKLTTRVPFGDFNAATTVFANRRAFESRYAAIIVEPETNPDYLRHLRQLCNAVDAILIFDEVITGFRFHLGGAQALYGVTPDLACFGKAMANGMPLSAVVGRKDIMRKFEPPDNVFYSGTFFGETLSLAASIAIIAKMERENAVEHLWTIGQYLLQQTRDLIDCHDLSYELKLHGQPPLVRLKFDNSRVEALFRKEMLQAGVLTVNCHALCYAHGPNEIKRVLRAYDHALGVIRKALDKGDIEKRLEGSAPLVAGVRT